MTRTPSIDLLIDLEYPHIGRFAGAGDHPHFPQQV